MSRPENGQSLSWTCAVPVLCALHCAAAPLLVGLLPALALSEPMEWLLMGGSLVLAAVVIGTGFRNHGLWLIPAVAVGGFVVWAGSLAGWFEPVPEVATTTAGSLAVAGGLFWNSRRSMQVRGSACGCPGCDGAEVDTGYGSDAEAPLRGQSASRISV
jgi:hypothetical protein